MGGGSNGWEDTILRTAQDGNQINPWKSKHPHTLTIRARLRPNSIKRSTLNSLKTRMAWEEAT